MFQTNLATGTFSKPLPTWHTKFPNSLGQGYSQQDFPTQIFIKNWHSSSPIPNFPNSRFFHKKLIKASKVPPIQSFKSSKLFPIKYKLFPMSFKLSQKFRPSKIGVEGFPIQDISSEYHLELLPCLLRPGTGNKCEVCDNAQTNASNMGIHITCATCGKPTTHCTNIKAHINQ